MSAQDASFLHIEDENNPMHIGSVVVIEGPPASYGDIVRAVAAKLPRVPRYRQRVRFVPMELGRPVWTDDPHFQILYHVRQTALPGPGGDEQLRNLAGRIFAQRLDRDKPLWELWVVEGLQGGRWALISKVHHCMVDGKAATDLLTVLMDREADSAPPPEEAWNPNSEPSFVHLLADAMADSVVEPVQHLRGLRVAARLSLPSFASVTDLARQASAMLAAFTIPVAGSLNGPIGPHRRWGWARGSLADVKTVRSALGGTVNDVVLAAITTGFRELLLSRGEAVEGKVVRTLVPVSMRAENERGIYNNRVSGVFPGLPVGVPDPVERLNLIREQMEGLKKSSQAIAGDRLTRLGGFAPPMLLAMGARLGVNFQQRTVQTVTTNVPGPQQPMYLVGRQLLEAYPYVPIGGSIRIGLAIFSYLDGINFGATADYDSTPDLDVLCRGIETGLAELLAEAGRLRASAPEPKASNGHRPRRTSGAGERARRAPRKRAPATP